MVEDMLRIDLEVVFKGIFSDVRVYVQCSF